MTPKERVRAVLRHETSDCIPNGLGGCETAGMHSSLISACGSTCSFRNGLPA